MIKDHIPYQLACINGNYNESKIVILGMPFDGTTSNRPGARFGPQAIRQEIDNLETYSPYQDRDLKDHKICYVGDISVAIGNTQRVLDTIETEINDVIKDEKKIISLGGEHLISYPIIKSFVRKYPKLHIIQLDAHTDLREEYLGEKLSHATVMKRVYETLSGGSLTQLGIRSGTKDEFEFAHFNTNIHKFDLGDINKIVEKIGTNPVYVSIDLDVLDPSEFSGTGSPEPGGITFKALIDGMIKLDRLNIVGADIVELAPHYDQSGVSTIVASKVLREMLLLMI